MSESDIDLIVQLSDTIFQLFLVITVVGDRFAVLFLEVVKFLPEDCYFMLESEVFRLEVCNLKIFFVGGELGARIQELYLLQDDLSFDFFLF